MAASRTSRRWIVAAAVLICGCGGNDRTPTVPTPAPTPGPPTPGTPTVPTVFGPRVFVGAGDIAMNGYTAAAQQTASLLEGIGGEVFAVGDLAYLDGSAGDFHDFYDPTWGRSSIKSRTRPVPGNHEYNSPNAQPYFDYWGAAAGPPGGYYSFDTLGAWHAIALNSGPEPGNANIPFVSSTSEQANWLRNDLRNNDSQCTIAYWHFPLFSSGQNGGRSEMRAFWQILYDARVDIVINGHDHLYERFAPQNPNGQSDPQRGITEFVVGTGGALLYQFTTLQPNSLFRLSRNGVLELTLSDSSYSWKFKDVSGGVPDQGGPVACHGRASAATAALKGFLLRRP